MKINETIRAKRKEYGLTQEQVAISLGVSASAVHKWEKGSSYPDITLLPALARLLRVDLNTLLSFHEDLTPEEIGIFCEEVVQTIREQGYEAGFQMAMEKLREYPASELLLSLAAGTLAGALVLFAPRDRERYEPEIEALHRRATLCENAQIRDQASVMLISRDMERGDFDGAQALLDNLPDPNIDKKMLQANLFCKQGRMHEAAELMERKLMSAANECYTALIGLLGLAQEEGESAVADTLAATAEDTVQLFNLWEYSAYVAPFQRAVAQRDAEKCIEVLQKMLPALKKRWTLADSPLYRHMKEKEQSGMVQEQMLEKVLEALQTDEEFAFLRADPEFVRVLKSPGRDGPQG